MQIIYKDEYDTTIYNDHVKIAIIPNINDIVIIEEDEYRVKSRIFLPKSEMVIIIITQNTIRKSSQENGDSTRLKEMSNAIMALGKRQDAGDKKTRLLHEQIISVKHLTSQRSKQDKKD